MAEVVSAGPFATEGERRAAAKLRELPDHWLVVCNKMLALSAGLTRETDFIVVGERWVFVIDEKSWWGKITGNDQLWFRDGNYSERSPLSKADNIARPLAGYLRDGTNQLRQNIGQWVRGGVLLSLGDQLPNIQDPRAADGIFLLADVCDRLKEIDRKGGSRDVGRGRDEIRACLLGLSDRPDVPSQIGLYRIDEAVSDRGGARVFQATMEGGGPRLLSVYDLGRDPIEPGRLREFYMREFGALQQLRSTGLVPEVADPFPWSDNYLVVPVTPPLGKDLGTYPEPETHDDLVNELALAATTFGALAQIHAAGVIHRALGPQAIVVTQGGQRPAVVLTNFFAARLDERSTIVTSLDALALDDPYVAPELVTGYGAATAASDAWSLGLTFLERIARVPIAELRQAPVEAAARLTSYWSGLPADAIAELTAIFTKLLQPVAADRLAPAAVATAFGDLTRRLRVEARAAEHGTLDNNRYAVQRVLGQGAMARTYLALDTEFGGLFALKQFLRPTLVLEQAGAEFNALRALHHPNLPRIFYVNPPQYDVHVILEYVPGPTLEEVADELPWPIDRWWPFAEDLLAAVEELETHHLLHRDIKPANIILRESDGRPVLIDFGLALGKGEAAHPAGTPLYLPPEALLAAQPPPTSDRYAAAAVLFKALTGLLPYESSGAGPRTVQLPTSVSDDRVRRIATVLLRAVANDPTERPATVAALRADLRAALAASDEPDETRDLPDLVNPWVDQVRGLYRNSAVGNADNRGLDSDFVRDTYVRTALDDRLLPAILGQHPRAVFLSGNPGDGKTAFLEQVRVALLDRGATEVHRDPSGWELALDGHTFRSCYDASESHDGQSADEQLTAKLAGLEGEPEPDLPLTVLVAINDGRLADFFARVGDKFPWLVRELANTRRRPAEDKPIWLVDLKRRAFVTLPGSGETSVALNVLARLVAPVEWEMCNGCAAHPVCPLRNNALALRRTDIRQRLEYLLLLAHLRRRRHTTMRDLRSAFAYLITGNTSCAEVHAVRHGTTEAPVALVDLAYWRSAFAPLDDGDELLADLNILDPARFPQPRLDRFLHFHRTDADAPERAALFAGQSDLPPQRFAAEGEWLAAMKRRLYFESVGGRSRDATRAVPPVAYRILLPYRYAISFLDLLAGRGDLDEAREQIALGLLRSDGYTGPARPGWLSLRVDASEEQQLVILKQFPLAEFALAVNRASGTNQVEAIPDGLTFAHSSGTPRLPITLDLHELLMRLADGLQPDAPEFRPLLEDLASFKSALLLRQTTDLILVESQRREHHVTQRDGKIVRIPASSGATSEVTR